MALTQMQLIQSLGEAMAWFERELHWGVPPTELRHLCGRIGELYAALITNGQMALATNQHGYDVVSAAGERVSVKTTAMTGRHGHVAFNPRSLNQVDRVIVLRVDTVEMQIEVLLDAPVADAIAMMTPDGTGKRTLALSRLVKSVRPRSSIKVTSEVHLGDCVVRELESGTIELERDGVAVTPVLPGLRQLAADLGIGWLGINGNPLNTRQLGNRVICSVLERNNVREGDDALATMISPAGD